MKWPWTRKQVTNIPKLEQQLWWPVLWERDKPMIGVYKSADIPTSSVYTSIGPLVYQGFSTPQEAYDWIRRHRGLVESYINGRNHLDIDALAYLIKLAVVEESS